MGAGADSIQRHGTAPLSDHNSNSTNQAMFSCMTGLAGEAADRFVARPSLAVTTADIIGDVEVADVSMGGGPAGRAGVSAKVGDVPTGQGSVGGSYQPAEDARCETP
ncbi:unnamed protein product [Prorocentrum cordatum]|uniref:Subtilisin n=1 Tax=Prorocentrum cordatum TaxID=2364126 RepID=A0ABN9VEI2_9DINO|nr:unnamed protein product [Polarella glacialis]